MCNIMKTNRDLIVSSRNVISVSMLGPESEYLSENSLFFSDRESILIFGGIDPHDTYGVGKNTGKFIYRWGPCATLTHVIFLRSKVILHEIYFVFSSLYSIGFFLNQTHGNTWETFHNPGIIIRLLSSREECTSQVGNCICYDAERVADAVHGVEYQFVYSPLLWVESL